MNSFKEFDEILSIDKQHLFMMKLGGKTIELKSYHQEIAAIKLHCGVPQTIVGQFNIARNMALYTFFFYSLGSEVQLKTYTIIEHALRIKANRQDLMLRQLLMKANQKNWLCDVRFRHVREPGPDNHYCESLPKVLPQLRNESAHGVPPLVWDCVGHIEKCADLVNQLFIQPKKASCPSASVSDGS